MSPLAGWLSCPHCAADLAPEGHALSCPRGHLFDIAKQGYVNLLKHGQPRNADTAAMLDARARFLGTGFYAPVADAVAAALDGRSRVVEVGAGTGYYLAQALDKLPDARGLATDVSIAAAKRAARAHPRAGAVVADTWGWLPLREGVADALLCVFAPRNPAEFERILEPGGRLVVAVPTARHLSQLRDRYGLLGVPDDKVDAVVAAFPGWNADVWTEEYQIAPSRAQTADLIAMGPNAFHGRPADVEELICTTSVVVITMTRP